MREKYELEDLLRIALQGLSPLGVEQVPLDQALDRALAWDMTALRDRPSLPVSPVNGYAVRTADLSGARRNRPVRLMVSDLIGPGLAVPIQAGEPVPAGCDAVVRREDTDGGSPALGVYRELWPYDNYIRRGSDYQAGDRLLSAGKPLDAASLCLLSSAGHNSAPVRARPRVSLTVGPAVLPESALYLHSLLESWNVELTEQKDAHILLLLGASLPQAQTLCTPPASPCGVLALARLDGRPVLTLAEGPVALFKAANLLVRPLLAYLTNSPAFLPQSAQAILDTPYSRASPARRFLSAHWEGGRVSLPQNGALRALPSANCLVDLPAGTPPLSAGTRVKVLRL